MSNRRISVMFRTSLLYSKTSVSQIKPQLPEDFYNFTSTCSSLFVLEHSTKKIKSSSSCPSQVSVFCPTLGLFFLFLSAYPVPGPLFQPSLLHKVPQTSGCQDVSVSISKSRCCLHESLAISLPGLFSCL